MEEWQGMRVVPGTLPWCDRPDGCGLALACVDGRCAPCEEDDECAAGEVCAVQHCVRQQLANCTTVRECGPRELCVLSGYSSDARGNLEMTAECLDITGGRRQTEELFKTERDLVRRTMVRSSPPRVHPDELGEGLVYVPQD